MSALMAAQAIAESGERLQQIRTLSAVIAEAISGIDPHLAAVAATVESVEKRWKSLCDVGCDPRLQPQHFGEMHIKFEGQLATVVMARLSHLLRAHATQFEPRVSPEEPLSRVAAHDLRIVQAHCDKFELEEKRYLDSRRVGQ